MFLPGQRVYNEAAPELGMGEVLSCEGRRVTVRFPLEGEQFTYALNSGPLQRVHFDLGDSISFQNGKEGVIENIEEREGLFVYYVGDQSYLETELSFYLSVTTPLEKFFLKHTDSNRLFKLRYQTHLIKRNYNLFAHKGLLGPKIRLNLHQLHIADFARAKENIRLLLADEVGLGKTIEACIITHNLLLRERIKNFLIIVPDSLVYQWFFELSKKFHLFPKTLSLQSHDTFDAKSLDDGNDFIISRERLIQSPELQADLLNRDWDLLIIDEAHGITRKGKEDREYLFFQKIGTQTPHLLLLSATPEILGQENFQLLLKLISEVKGPFFVRNTRSKLEEQGIFFPKRELCDYPISTDAQSNLTNHWVFEQKMGILFDVLQKYPTEKILLLCHSKELIHKISHKINENMNIKMALFYSEQSLVERDRQAAYFADEAGARLLLCTEIGSEGRNFEFSHHLFLFDIPKVADQLEQRIGRLDRIGQKENIQLHLPYVKKSFEEILFRWYNEVFCSFKEVPQGSSEFYLHSREELQELLTSPFEQDRLDDFITKSQTQYRHYLESMGLLDDSDDSYYRFNKRKADEFLMTIESFQRENNLLHYMDEVFDAIGVDFQLLDEKTYFAIPRDTMLIPSFPSLLTEGQSFTFHREHAISRDDLGLLSWEHPMILGMQEIFTNSPVGNVTLGVFSKNMQQNILFEIIIKLAAKAPRGDSIHQYFPLTPVRVLLNERGEDLTKRYPKKVLDEISRDPNPHEKEIFFQLPKNQMKEIVRKGKIQAQERITKYRQQAFENIPNGINNLEHERLKNLISNIKPEIDSLRILFFQQLI